MYLRQPAALAMPSFVEAKYPHVEAKHPHVEAKYPHVEAKCLQMESFTITIDKKKIHECESFLEVRGGVVIGRTPMVLRFYKALATKRAAWRV